MSSLSQVDLRTSVWNPTFESDGENGDKYNHVQFLTRVQSDLNRSELDSRFGIRTSPFLKYVVSGSANPL